MDESKRNTLRAIALSPLLLTTNNTLHAKPGVVEFDLAEDLRDSVRRKNARIKSYHVRIVKIGNRRNQESDVLSNVETFYNGHQYLDHFCDSSNNAFAFRLRTPKYEVLGKLDSGRPFRARRLKTKKWPSSPNEGELFPVPGVFPTAISDERFEISGTDVITLQQGRDSYWIDAETLEVLRTEQLEPDGQTRLVREFSNFRTTKGDAFRMAHEVKISSSILRGQDLQTVNEVFAISEARVWASPQPNLFEVEPLLQSLAGKKTHG